jgi:hypothetical protein
MTPEEQETIRSLRQDLGPKAKGKTDAEILQFDQCLSELASICVDEIIRLRREKGLKTEEDIKAYFQGELDVSPTGERLTFRLPDIECPDCNLTVHGKLLAGSPKAATCYDDCIRKCPNCHTAWSNALNNPVRCVDRATKNVPREVRNHLNAVLSNSLNERNHGNKLIKFAFETSEDAVTWTVFNGLQNAHLLPQVLQKLVADSTLPFSSRPVMLLWGCPVPPASKAGAAIRDRLVGVSDAIGENPIYRSEPDVILDFGPAGLVFIEVKLHSGNEIREDAQIFARYVDPTAFADPAAGTRSGYYELVRNWRLGVDLADDRPFFLLNLGPDRIFDDKDEAARWREFTTGIGAQANRRFLQVRWSTVQEILSDPTVSWLRDFLESRLRR